MIGDLFAALFLVTLIYILVRPNSKAADAVDLIGNALSSLVNAATREVGE
jgi:hypothetical protein